jgi:molybdate transport system ATP-binding protein
MVGNPMNKSGLTSGLVAEVVVHRPRFSLNLNLTVNSGETLAVMGPNGAGKTTLLMALAGIVSLDAGTIRVGDTEWETPSRRLRLRPDQRRAGVVFQDYLLFPHLTARDNVAFGPSSRGLSRTKARRLADCWLHRLGIDDHAESLPRKLSGGQAQRVALARALAAEPQLLLLDEPLTALDAEVRSAVRAQLRGCLAAFPGVTVLVSHDLTDVVALADTLAVVSEGKLVQLGTPREVIQRPASAYVASAVGTNLLEVEVACGKASLGDVVLPAPGVPNGPAKLALVPSAVRLFREDPGDDQPAWRGIVTEVVPQSENLRVMVSGPHPVRADVPFVGASDLLSAIDHQVWISVDPTRLNYY